MYTLCVVYTCTLCYVCCIFICAMYTLCYVCCTYVHLIVVTCALPDMYTLIPWACGPREFSCTYQAEHKCTCYIYYWSDPHSNVESGAVAHVQRITVKNRTAIHYCSLVQWFMYKQT